MRVLNKEKAGHFMPGFFFVAGDVEISNLLEHFYLMVDLYDHITENSEI
jgi:hypothetical protein